MTQLVLSMLVEAKTQAARGEVVATVSEVKKLTAATKDGGDASRTAAQDAAALGAVMGTLKAEIAAASAVEAAGTAALREMGGASSGASAEAKALDAELKVLRGTLAGLVAQEQAATQAIDASAREFADLKASVDPAFAAQRRYEDQVERVTRAVRLGAVGQEEANRVLAMSRAQYATAAAGLGSVSAAARGFDFRGPMQQLSQVSQQAMATGNVVQALAIQAPDLGLAFGPVGIAAGVLVGLLLPLGASLLGVGDNAEEAETGVDAFTAALERYEGYAATARMSTAELREEYGEFAEVVRANAEWMSRVELARSLGALDGTDFIGGMSEAVEAVEQLRAVEAQAAAARADAAAGSFTAGTDAATLEAEVAQLRAIAAGYGDLYGLEIEQVEALKGAYAGIDAARASGDPAQLAAAAGAALDLIRSISAESLDIPDALATGAAQLQTILEQAAAAVATQADVVDDTSETRERDVSLARDMVATMEDQIALSDAIARFGADSEEVARVRLEQEQAKRREMAATLDLTGQEEAALMQVLSRMEEIEAQDLAAPFRDAADEAERMVRAANSPLLGLDDERGSQRDVRADAGRYRADDIASRQQAAEAGIFQLIRFSEGTAAGSRGYNETLGNGRFTGGDVDLVNMTLNEVLALQRQMLRDPANAATYGDASSALGAYQIVGTTLGGEGLTGRGGLMRTLGLSGNELFDANMQDRLAEELLRGRRGQGITGLRNEWEGLQNVPDALIQTALGQQSIPRADAEAERERTTAATEGERTFAAAMADGVAIREGLRTAEEALAAERERLNGLVAQGALTQAEADAEYARSYAAYVAALDPAAAAAQAFAAEQERINAAFAAGAIAADVAAQQLAAAQATYQGALRDIAAAADPEAAARAEERMQAVGETGREMLRGIYDDAVQGASGMDILTGAVGRLGERLADSGLDMLGDALFGTGEPEGGRGLLGGLFSGMLGGGGGGGGLLSGLLGGGGGGLGPLNPSSFGITLPPALLAKRSDVMPDLQPMPAEWRRASRGGAEGAEGGKPMGGELRVTIVPTRDFDARIEGQTRRVAAGVMREGFDRYDRALPLRMRQIGADPDAAG